MKYYLCVRKSTEEDSQQVLSIEAQLIELKEFAAKEKLKIVSDAAPRLRRDFGGQAPPFRIFAGYFLAQFFLRKGLGEMRSD